MAEHTTVFITGTTPGIGTRTYTESGRKYSMDVDGLSANTEYEANAEYEKPDGTVLQTTQGVIFRTLAAGTFTISNEHWENNSDGLTSTVTFTFTSTYAISSIIIQDNGVQTAPQYQCSISGNSGTATLPYYASGTQHAMAFLLTDIYAGTANIGRILTLQASMSETPFYIEAENPSDAPQISLVKVGSPTSLTMQTSYDKSTWTNYTIGNSIELSEEHPRIYFKNASRTKFSTGLINYYKFTADDYVNVGGNIASLRDSSMANNASNSYDFCNLFYQNAYLRNANKLYLGNYTTLASYCHSYMFRDCTALTQAPVLPATTMARSCYQYMFSGCTALTQAPVLPATTMDQSCYNYMFNECTSLTQAPTLPATTLASSCYSYMFSGCTSLTQAPVLPATTMASSCYSNMFSGCTSLRTTPALPATTLDSSCYYRMFYGCTGITQAPTLPATTLASSCYSGMFQGCTSLRTAPALPATTIATSCYSSMFYGCTGITQAPALPATILANSCYYRMFQGCTGITQAPKLHAAILANNCYQYMFYDCTSLREIECLAEDISATNCTADWVVNVAANGTFIKSPNMSSWTIGDSGIPTSWVTQDYQFSISNPAWQISNAAGTSSTLTFDFTSPNTLSRALVISEGVTYQGVISGRSVTVTGLPGYSASTQRTFQIIIADSYGEEFTQDYSLTLQTYIDPMISVPFYIESNGATAVTIYLIKSNTSPYYQDCVKHFQYSYDNQTWTSFEVSIRNSVYEAQTSVSLQFDSHDKIYLRIDPRYYDSATGWLPAYASRMWFTYDGNYSLGGNLASLTSADLSDLNNPANTTWTGVLASYSSGNEYKLISVNDLYFHEGVTSDCYKNLFKDCKGLTTAPRSLPATTLASHCYDSMFAGCISLTNVPVLPATTLANYCYYRMFQNCTGVTQAPTLPATTLANYCYDSMFYGCSSLTTAPDLPATTLANYCYEYMFYHCTSLTTSPALPATTLVDYCYNRMFAGCTSLREITCLAEDISASDCTNSWLYSISSPGTFYKSPNMSSWTTGPSGIPVNWTVVDYRN